MTLTARHMTLTTRHTTLTTRHMTLRAHHTFIGFKTIIVYLADFSTIVSAGSRTSLPALSSTRNTPSCTNQMQRSKYLLTTTN